MCSNCENAQSQDKAESKYLVKTVETQVETPSHILYHVTVNKTEAKNPKNFRTSLRVVLHDKEDGTNHVLLDTAPKREAGGLSGKLMSGESNRDPDAVINETNYGQDEPNSREEVSKGTEANRVNKNSLKPLPSIVGFVSGLGAIRQVSNGLTLPTSEPELEAGKATGTGFNHDMQLAETTTHGLRNTSPNITNMTRLSNSLDQETDSNINEPNLTISGSFALPAGNISLSLMTGYPTKLLTNLENRVHATTPKHVPGSLFKDDNESSERSSIKSTASTAALFSAGKDHDTTSNPQEPTHPLKLRNASDESNMVLSSKIQERLRKNEGRKRKKPRGQGATGFGHVDQLLETAEHNYSVELDKFSSYPSHGFTTPLSPLRSNAENTVGTSEKGKGILMVTVADEVAIYVGSTQASETESPKDMIFKNNLSVYSEDQTSSFPSSNSRPDNAHSQIAWATTALPNQNLDGEHATVVVNSAVNEDMPQKVENTGKEAVTAGKVYHNTTEYDNYTTESLTETVPATKEKKRKQKMEKNKETSTTVNRTEDSFTETTQSKHERDKQDYVTERTKTIVNAFVAVNGLVIAKASRSTTTRSVFAQVGGSDTIPTLNHSDIVTNSTSVSATIRNKGSSATKMSNLEASSHPYRPNYPNANILITTSPIVTMKAGTSQETHAKTTKIRQGAMMGRLVVGLRQVPNNSLADIKQPITSNDAESSTRLQGPKTVHYNVSLKELRANTTSLNVVHPTAGDILVPFSTPYRPTYNNANISIRTNPTATMAAATITETAKKTTKIQNGAKIGRFVFGLRQVANNSLGDITQPINNSRAGTSPQRKDLNTEDVLKSFSTPYLRPISTNANSSTRTSPIVTVTAAHTTEPSAKTKQTRNGAKIGRLVVGLHGEVNNQTGGSTESTASLPTQSVTEDVHYGQENRTHVPANVHDKSRKNRKYMESNMSHPLAMKPSQKPHNVNTTGTENYENGMLKHWGTTSEQSVTSQPHPQSGTSQLHPQSGTSKPHPQSHNSTKHHVKSSVYENTEKPQVSDMPSAVKLAVTPSSQGTTTSDGTKTKFMTKSSTLTLKTKTNFETTTENIVREKPASTAVRVAEVGNNMPVAERLEGTPSPITEPDSTRELRSKAPTPKLGRIALPNGVQPNNLTSAFVVSTTPTVIYGPSMHPKRLEAAKLAVRIRRVESHLNRTAELLAVLKKNLVHGRKKAKNRNKPIQNGRAAPAKLKKDGKSATAKPNKNGKSATAKPKKHGRVVLTHLGKLQSTMESVKLNVPFESLAKFVPAINPGEDEDEDEHDNDAEEEDEPLQSGNQDPDGVPRQDEGEGDRAEPAENTNNLSLEESPVEETPAKKTRKKPIDAKTALARGRVALAYESPKEEIPPEVLAAQRGKKTCLSSHEFNSIVSLSIKPALDEKLKGVPCPNKLPCQGWGTCTLLWNTGLVSKQYEKFSMKISVYS